LPDYFSFVKGLADSPDLKLNISRETLQHDHQLKVIAKNIEKKIKAELTKLLNNERSLYEEFYGEFGLQLKYGLYASYGMNKDVLQDLLLFRSAKEDKYVSLKEYIGAMDGEQKNIYYACGESTDAAKMLPQTDAVLSKGYDVLLFTDEVDEFTISMLREYDGKQFMNVCAENLDISTEEEKNAIKEFNETNKSLTDYLKEKLAETVTAVKFTNTLGDHPVCLSSEGGISTEMEKVLSKMPGANGEFAPKAEIVLEINSAHPIAQRLIDLYDSDKELVGEYGEILYAQARLISGLSVSNPTELAEKICRLMVK
jgi:molecular chaperone HtpG